MKYPQHTLIVFLLVLVSLSLLSVQGNGQPIRIDNSDADTVFYCGDPVEVAPGIIVENFSIEEPTDGIKISIVNYVPGEDRLFYTGNEFISYWDDTVGNLEITGLGSAAELQKAVRNVFYENTSGAPANEFRSISISLLDADFLPDPGHFYKYIPQSDISWSAARDSAADMEYYGLQGYLATIMSPGENDFIWSKIDGIGWIGATDEEEEGTWRWVTGPEGLEGGTVFWQGDATGQPVDSLYSKWSQGEPNNNYEEDYAHINLDPNKADKTWNDLPNVGGGGVYRSQGYIVEFGGMPGDPEIQLSASAVVSVYQSPEEPDIGFDTLICEGLVQQLQIDIDADIFSVMHSLDSNALVYQETSLSPVVEVEQYGRYRFVLQTYYQIRCSRYDTIEIEFQHQPVAAIDPADLTCVEPNLQLSFDGQVEGDAVFEWYFNDTLYVSGPEVTSVNIPPGEGVSNRTVGLKVSEGGCADSIQLPVTFKPAVEIQADIHKGCSPLNVQFSYTTSEPVDDHFWKFGADSTSVAENPSFTFRNTGTDANSYDVSLSVISSGECQSGDTIVDLITVHPVPDVGLSFDESVCYEGNEEIWYSGSAGERDTFLWDLSGIPAEDIVQDPGLTAGPLQLNLTGTLVADIGLQVISEFGCTSDTLIKTFTRKPVLGLPADTLGGCPPFEVEMSVSTAGFSEQVDYLWDLGNGQTAEGSTVSPVYVGEDQYYDVSVYGASSQTGCADTLMLPGKIHVFPVPEASFTAHPLSVPVTDSEISFENTSSGAARYEWDFGDDAFGSTAENPVHRFENLGLFDVTLLAVNEFECVDSASAQISVTFDRLFPPTAFSPNAAREEDREFRIYAEGIVNEGYKLLIFNRWGEVVHTSLTPEEGWDGTMKNGANAPPGTYFWVLEFLDLIGEEHTQKGSLTLLY